MDVSWLEAGLLGKAKGPGILAPGVGAALGAVHTVPADHVPILWWPPLLLPLKACTWPHLPAACLGPGGLGDAGACVGQPCPPCQNGP
eukprot:5781565-Lingulodinium_polyedra.AAC.1